MQCGISFPAPSSFYPICSRYRNRIPQHVSKAKINFSATQPAVAARRHASSPLCSNHGRHELMLYKMSFFQTGISRVRFRSPCNVWYESWSQTRSSAVAKRPRDASCLYSFNTKRRAQSFIISCFGFRYTTAYN